MPVPNDRKYSQTHEWFKPEGKTVTVGITQFAADELTDITYVELPPVGKPVTAGQPFGEIESVKATSELFAPLSGKVAAINKDLADNPGLINEDPWEAGWLIAIAPSNPTEFDSLMDGAEYDRQVEAEKH